MASTRIYRSISSAGTTTKATFSAWVKRAGLAEGFLFFSKESGNENFRIRFNPTVLNIEILGGGSVTGTLSTNRHFRDTTSWYHIVVALDSTLATADDRMKLYVNGVQETSFSSRTNPSQNYNMRVNETGTQYIGSQETSNYFDGNLAHVHYIDGTAYAASTFGETDSTSGIWKPKASPSGITYGTNGFFLKFENSGNMDLDSSGNNLSFTTSGTPTQNVDTPTNNYPTLNKLAPSQNNRTGGNGNLYTGDSSNNAWSSFPSTMACESGKWYFEIKDETDWGSTSDSTRRYGIVDLSANISQSLASAGDVRFSDSSYAYAYMNESGVRTGGSTISGSASDHPTFAEGDFIMVAMDLDNNKLYFGKNGTWNDSGNPASGATGTGSVANLASGAWSPYLEVKYGSDTASINFGQGYFKTAVAGTNADANGHGKFKYSVPSGYYAICTKNIKEFG